LLQGLVPNSVTIDTTVTVFAVAAVAAAVTAAADIQQSSFRRGACLKPS
jgi:hypothetical protein